MVAFFVILVCLMIFLPFLLVEFDSTRHRWFWPTAGLTAVVCFCAGFWLPVIGG